MVTAHTYSRISDTFTYFQGWSGLWWWSIKTACLTQLSLSLSLSLWQVISIGLTNGICLLLHLGLLVTTLGQQRLDPFLPLVEIAQAVIGARNQSKIVTLNQGQSSSACATEELQPYSLPLWSKFICEFIKHGWRGILDSNFLGHFISSLSWVPAHLAPLRPHRERSCHVYWWTRLLLQCVPQNQRAMKNCRPRLQTWFHKRILTPKERNVS